MEIITIRSSTEVYNVAISNWNLKTIEFQEVVKVIYLNRGNNVLGLYEVSKGGISSSVVEIKQIVSIALKVNASSLILIHNHPSGNLKPSNQDIELTKKLKLACDYFELALLDHLIISRNSFYSFNDESIL